MKRKLFCALALCCLLLLAACGEEEAPAPSSSAPAPSSQSVQEEAPASSQTEESPASSQPEESDPAPSSQPEVSSAPAEPAPEPASEAEPTWEEMTDEERQTLDRTRQALTSYLEETLGTEGYTYFYYTDDQLGLGIAAPDLEAARAAVEAYEGDPMPVEYLETAHSRAELDAAYEDYRAMADPLRGTDEEIVANISSGGEQGGYILITVHEMYPALEEYLEESEYRDCFRVEITGGESPIVNPDT